MLYARVAVPRPLYRTFLYRIPDELVGHVEPGSRVVVPFRQRQLTGWVDEVTAEPGRVPARLRDILDAPDAEPALDSELLEICRWVARYYVAPLGLAFRAALPASLTAESAYRLVRSADGSGSEPEGGAELELLRFVEAHRGPVKLSTARKTLGSGPWTRSARALAAKGLIAIEEDAPPVEPPVPTRQVAVLARELPSLRERDSVFGRAHRQRELYEYLESAGGRAEVVHLTRQLGISRSVIHGLVDRGLARLREEAATADALLQLPAPAPAVHTPTDAQAEVVRRLVDASSNGAPPGVFLLKGVTASGKTLVYIELLRELVSRRGRGAILLVPEISLTPQTLGRLRAAFGDEIALMHSALSESERYEAWRSLREGRKRIVVGARSAVFAPVRDLGAIVLDEEHEASYKQSDPAPRYHAREVAVMRARRAQAVCVLGSATPSLESWANARSRKWTLLELPERIGARPLPAVDVVDLRAERGRPRNGSAGAPPVLSVRLEQALRERLRRGEQSILLLNRRGYAAFVQCRDCGDVIACPHCNVSLTHHRRPARLLCHHCSHERPVPEACPACGSTDLSHRGLGTEQVEHVLGETFPTARVARMDVDTTSAKWSHHEILGRVERREVDILMGTQMIAKGLDFPGVTLVGVVNADVGLNLPDFRASERTFQLLTQVAGRAGRGTGGGAVVIQTALPTHYAIAHAVDHDYDGFAAREYEERSAPAYPPHVRLVNIVVSGRTEGATQEAAEDAAIWLSGLFRARKVGGIQLVGPAPCPIDRLRRRWRWHLLMKAERAEPLGRVLSYFARKWRPASGAGMRVEIDRDPVSLL